MIDDAEQGDVLTLILNGGLLDGKHLDIPFIEIYTAIAVCDGERPPDGTYNL